MISRINDFIKKLTNFQTSILFFVIALFTYGNTLFNGFVYDDFNYLINNPQLHSLNLSVLFGKNLFNMAGQYRPMSATYLAFLYSLFGNNASPYHFVQILLHVAIVIMVFIIFQKFSGKTFALILSILFLVHPMNTESVSYIASAQDLLFSLFGLGAFLLWINKPQGRKIILVFILLLLSILTKEEGIVYIFLLIFYSVIFDRKTSSKSITLGISTAFVYLLIRIFIGQVYFTTRILAPIASLNLLERLLNIPAIVFHYVITFFYPATLAVDQQWVIKSATFSTFYFPLIVEVLLISLVAGLGLYIFKKDKEKFNTFIFFLIWFLLGLAPHLQIFPLDFTVTDRWFYFPMMGLLGMIGVTYSIFIPKTKISWTITTVVVSIIILAFGIRTITRNFDWKNNLTLFTHDIKIEDNFDIEIFLGNEYLDDGVYDKAFYYLNKSVSSVPNELNLHNLGVAYERSGNLEMARQYYYQALHARDYHLYDSHLHDLSSYNSYASMLVFFDDPKTAEEFIQEGLKDYPDAGSLWFFLSLSRIKQKDEIGALQAATKAYVLNPSQENFYLYSHLINKVPMKITVYGKNFDF